MTGNSSEDFLVPVGLFSQIGAVSEFSFVNHLFFYVPCVQFGHVVGWGFRQNILVNVL